VANVGPLEVIAVLIIALVVFGPKRVPELGKSLGKGIREFRTALADQSGAEEEEREQVAPTQLPASSESPGPVGAETAEDEVAAESGT
jgi:sec-independent protein translocase protein TatA